MPGRHDTAVSPASGYSAANPSVERMSVPARMLVVAALIAGAVYLGWRWGFTLDGASLWVGTPLALAETYALIMLALLAFSCWALSDRPQPPPLRGRRVAIFIATYNESEDVLRPTVVGALRVRHSPAAEVGCSMTATAHGCGGCAGIWASDTSPVRRPGCTRRPGTSIMR